jgi:hypothetical protein
LDSDSGPPDLKFYGRLRSVRTPSFKWFYQIYWILIERPGSKERELTGLKLGFRPSSPARRAEGGRRRRYSDSWTMASSRQDAGGGGELGCVVSLLDSFQMPKGATAGDVDGDCELRVASLASICCELETLEGIRG